MHYVNTPVEFPKEFPEVIKSGEAQVEDAVMEFPEEFWEVIKSSEAQVKDAVIKKVRSREPNPAEPQPKRHQIKDCGDRQEQEQANGWCQR